MLFCTVMQNSLLKPSRHLNCVQNASQILDVSIELAKQLPSLTNCIASNKILKLLVATDVLLEAFPGNFRSQFIQVLALVAESNTHLIVALVPIQGGDQTVSDRVRTQLRTYQTSLR